MKILLTGYKGFIGTNLVKKLEKHKIIGVDLNDGNDILDSNYINALFEFYHFDAIIHLAAIAGVGYSIEHSEEVLTNNIIGFDVLAKAAIKHNVKHFIYASSSSVYGDDGTQKSPYAVSKATNELQAAMYSNLSDMKFTGMRFFTVYGEGIREDLAISKFIKAMKANEPLYVYGDGEQKRDFTYVDDICEAIKLILESDKEWRNEVFDIGYGSSTSVNELIGILKGIININYDKVIYQDEKAYDVKATLANANKLYEWFGFKPRYDIKKGLREWQLK
ncbi:NAD-dependent epimerase/dehydratase family protein [uncultured Methanobrevibacter sp.]|uniref:NAD-dependent epimerase/dehydratase family protein n=1 Tax=uncultured Methanobrevibacter sp. TaxID=253161 RepID=UPI0025D52F88|nr:NAD-dependent epimerase/dehydratase family protein [uncultured Methanobrevibacter sp.]